MDAFSAISFACLFIEDSAEGISEELLPSLFDLYKPTKSDGIGIGRWLSKIIIEKHNGSIAASNKPDGGAFSVVRLPLLEQHP